MGLADQVVTRLKSLVVAAAVLALTACGSGFHLNPDAQVQGLMTSSTLYSVDGVNGRVLRYTPNSSGSAALSSSINLPLGLTPNIVATDASGNIYVGGYTTSVNTSEVVEYASGATGEATPVRTLQLQTGKLTALAVDKTGQIYAAQLNVLASITIYAAGAQGITTPIRTINPTYFFYLNDLSLDSSGNLYVTGWNGGAYFINEFGPAANGSAASIRTLWAPNGSYFGGLTVDNAGNIFVMEKLTICELAAGTTGTPTPVQSINLPAAIAPYTIEAYSNVLRRDAQGNFLVPVTMSNASSAQNYVFGFASNATGTATPILQFAATNATVSTPLGINIPLAVF